MSESRKAGKFKSVISDHTVKQLTTTKEQAVEQAVTYYREYCKDRNDGAGKVIEESKVQQFLVKHLKGKPPEEKRIFLELVGNSIEQDSKNREEKRRKMEESLASVPKPPKKTPEELEALLKEIQEAKAGETPKALRLNSSASIMAGVALRANSKINLKALRDDPQAPEAYYNYKAFLSLVASVLRPGAADAIGPDDRSVYIEHSDVNFSALPKDADGFSRFPTAHPLAPIEEDGFAPIPTTEPLARVGEEKEEDVNKTEEKTKRFRPF